MPIKANSKGGADSRAAGLKRRWRSANRAPMRRTVKRLAPFRLSNELIAYIQHIAETYERPAATLAEEALWRGLPDLATEARKVAAMRKRRRKVVAKLTSGTK